MSESLQKLAERPVTLVPVGLKEAALDSPTFRSGVLHYTDQFDFVEKWLESYAKAVTRISHEIGTLEGAINGFFAQSVPPSNLSEAILDHDYTLTAVKRYGEGAREVWTGTVLGMRKMEQNIVEPIRAFIQNDLRYFKDTRRSLEQAQKLFDSLQSRYSAQTRGKEPSSLREDAFQLHEARKSYLKISMDFSVMAPQVRVSLDKLLVKAFSDQWRDMQKPRDNTGSSLFKWGAEIERMRGWIHEIENGEESLRRELEFTRKQLEESTESAVRPSRDLEDYSVSTTSTLGSKGPSTAGLHASTLGEVSKSVIQGWLNLKTVTGKPSRTVWLRRWFFVKNGIFGWLVQGSRSGGVEESDRIGVLLCNVRPATSEERRFTFEVKTKDMTLVLQAETYSELLEWMGTFELAKRRALEDPASTDSPGFDVLKTHDAAFAISSPSAPEFAATAADAGMLQSSDDNTGSFMERNPTLSLPLNDTTLGRSSTDFSHRRSTGDREGESSRDHAVRIIQKLDLHRKPTSVSQFASNTTAPPPANPAPAGGIASLIATSHNIMPIGPGILPQGSSIDTPASRSLGGGGSLDLPSSSLAPTTLANPPAPTNLSAAAVLVNCERGIGLGRIDASGGIPSGIMANVWGSSSWGYLNQIQRGEAKAGEVGVQVFPSRPNSGKRPSESPTVGHTSSPNLSPHRKTSSLPTDTTSIKGIKPTTQEYPSSYPHQLKTQDAQFRLLFPNVSETVVYVFKAMWSLNDYQEFPGRVYVTTREIYFYSNHIGLTLILGVSLQSISEVTAAQGRFFDLLFFHLNESGHQGLSTRITVKTFLEPLKVLEHRLNFLVRSSVSNQPLDLGSIIKGLIDLGQDSSSESSLESWEEASLKTTQEYVFGRRRIPQNHRDLKASVIVDRGFYAEATKRDETKDTNKIKLPKQPVNYVPTEMGSAVVEKVFDISPKALFHVMFGDRSAIFYYVRDAQRIKQGSWTQSEQNHFRREFSYFIEYQNYFGRRQSAKVTDHQLIEVFNDHLCYVVTDRKTPWHLPYRENFTLLNKIAITHFAKSKCKLAIYTKVDWVSSPGLVKGFIHRQASKDMRNDALDLADVITDQVRKLGAQSRTKKAIEIFGHIGQQTQVSEFTGSDAPINTQTRRSIKHRTMFGIIFESVNSLFKSTITTTTMCFFTLLRWIWKTFNANSFILSILALSIIGNFILSSRSTLEWWSERRAGILMTQLGVGPHPVMSKTVYLRDISDIISSNSEPHDESSGVCRNSFQKYVNADIMDAPQQSIRNLQMRPFADDSVHRLRRSRQRLGSYRHKLLVAVRVVNSIEREIIEAEWEQWLLSENAKCAQVGKVLRNNNTIMLHDGRPKQHNLTDIKAWHGIYCRSCSREQAGYSEEMDARSANPGSQA